MGKLELRTPPLHKITQAVILAGGQGKRLQPFTLKNPKPMILINGKPFLEHLLNLIKQNGIKQIVILTGYLGEKIEKYFGDGKKFGLQIIYSYTPLTNQNGEENESGLRLKNAEGLLDDYFLLLYCDNYWPLDIKKLIYFFKKYPSDMLITAYSNQDNSTKNNMLVDNGYVTKYDQSRKEKYLNCVDIGFFIVNKKILKMLPKSNSKFENIVLPKLIKRKRLSAYLSDQKYYSIGDVSRVKITEKFLIQKKIIFLDRDGVINKKPPKAEYVKDWTEFFFLPGAIEAIKILRDKGYRIFIISNQAGIARKVMSRNKLDLIHKKMQAELKTNDTEIDGIYFCPHGWDDNCNCRKPKPGMLLQASREHFIDLRQTIFIGDDDRDKQAGDAVGCKTILVTSKKSFLAIAKQIVHNM